MECKKLKLFDILSLVVTMVATCLELAMFYIPVWWRYADGSELQEVGVYLTYECTVSKGVITFCTSKTLIDIEGELEWLFIARMFLVFSTALCLVSLLLHLVFIPFRREGFRTATIYSLLAAGLFCLGGSITFGANYSSLGKDLIPEYATVQFPFGLAIASGFFLLIAAAVTALANFKETRNPLDDDDDDDEDFQKWRAEQNLSFEGAHA